MSVFQIIKSNKSETRTPMHAEQGHQYAHDGFLVADLK
jgi:hypothetical protein